MINVVTQLEFPPNAVDRGGFGIAGLALADVLDTGMVADELVATTLAGDIVVFGLSASSLVPLYRSWAAGGVGLYNSIVPTNLGTAGAPPAIYCGGSLGLRKWRRP